MTFAAARVAHGVIARRAARIGVALPVLESSTHSDNASGDTSKLITKPSGTVQNDLLLAVFSWDAIVTGVIAPSDAVPWIEVHQTVTSNSHATAALFYKIAGGAEPSDYTFTWTNGQQIGGWMGRFSGIDTANPINARSIVVKDGADGGNFDVSFKFTGVVTDITNTLLVHAIATGAQGGNTSFENGPAAATIIVNDNAGGTGGVTHLVATEPLTGAGGTGSRQWDGIDAASGVNGRINQLITITPIEGVPDKLEFEATTDNLLLEDGSGVLILE